MIPLAGERGSSYELTSTKSSENLTVLNSHGDYGQANSVAMEITSALQNPNTIALGDTNIALTKKDAVAKMANMKGIVVEPSTNIEGTDASKRTLDCFVTNIPTNYIFKDGCKNYATEFVETKNYDPSLFSNKQENVNVAGANNSFQFNHS